jgi:hypothetical protein
MKVGRAVPTETNSERLSVQPVREALVWDDAEVAG